MIRLATVIGHGLNLLPHFIKHYENIVDEINIGVYITRLTPTIQQDIERIIKGHDRVKISICENGVPFNWDHVTKMYNRIKWTHPEDYWVIADIDEFHLYSYDRLYYVVEKCREHGWEIVRGGFLDRVSENGDFPEIQPNVDIFEQFPNAGFFRYPMSDACPNKICIVKGDIEISSGQHYAIINGQTTWRWQGWNHPLIAPYEEFSVQVHHFKWDNTSIGRLLSVADVKQEYAFSEEYKKMYESLSWGGFKIYPENERYMFEKNTKKEFGEYTQWNKLMKKIVSI